jgi:hypothetical protein
MSGRDAARCARRRRTRSCRSFPPDGHASQETRLPTAQNNSRQLRFRHGIELPRQLRGACTGAPCGIVSPCSASATCMSLQGVIPARRRMRQPGRFRVHEDTAESAATKKPRFEGESGPWDECWYRIPESRRSSGGVRLSTVATVGSGRLRWVPAGLRVRMRVQRDSPTKRLTAARRHEFVLRGGLVRPLESHRDSHAAGAT